MATEAIALRGGVLSLVLTGTALSISTSVGIISTLGVAILDGVLLVSSFTEFQEGGITLKETIRKGAEQQMRPVLIWRCGGPAPGSRRHRDRFPSQQPLARVVVGGMLTAAVLILIVLPVLYHLL